MLKPIPKPIHQEPDHKLQIALERLENVRRARDYWRTLMTNQAFVSRKDAELRAAVRKAHDALVAFRSEVASAETHWRELSFKETYLELDVATLRSEIARTAAASRPAPAAQTQKKPRKSRDPSSDKLVAAILALANKLRAETAEPSQEPLPFQESALPTFQESAPFQESDIPL